MLPAQSAWVATRTSPGDERERVGYDWPSKPRLRPPMRSWRPSEWRDWSIWASTQESVGYGKEEKLLRDVPITNYTGRFVQFMLIIPTRKLYSHGTTSEQVEFTLIFCSAPTRTTRSLSMLR